MATGDICALPLWAVDSHLPDALPIVRAWASLQDRRLQNPPAGDKGEARARRYGCVQPGGLAPTGALPEARRGAGADRAGLRGRAASRTVRPAAGVRLAGVGQRGRV